MSRKSKKINLIIGILTTLSLVSCKESPTTSKQTSNSTNTPNSSELNSSSSQSSIKDKTKLQTPTGLSIIKGKLSWRSVLNASSYDIYLDDNLISSTIETSYDLSTAFTNSGTKSIGIIANPSENNDDYKASDMAYLDVTVHKLKTPTVTIEQDESGSSYFAWDIVANATGYAYSFDNWSTSTNVGSDVTSFHPNGLGLYQISVKALGTISGTEFYIDSAASALSEAIGQKGIVDENGHISFIEIPGATKYDLYLNGSLAKENINPQTGVDLLATEDSIVTRTGVYSVSIKALNSENNVIDEFAVGSYQSPILNRNEIYSFDNNKMPEIIKEYDSNIALSLDNSIKNGTDGYSLKGVMNSQTNAWSHFTFDFSNRNDVLDNFSNKKMVSFYFYAEKPSDLVPNSQATEDYLPSNAIPWLDLGTGWTKDAYKLETAWPESSTTRINPLDDNGQAITKVKYGEWTKLNYLLPQDQNALSFFKDHKCLVFTTTIAKGDWGYASWNDAAVASQSAFKEFNIHMDDFYFEDYNFDPNNFGTEGINWAKATGGSGSEFTTNDRIVLEISNAIENRQYDITLKFKVMNSMGKNIYGNGTWGRRLVLPYDGKDVDENNPTIDATEGKNSSYVYALPSNEKLSNTQTISANATWMKSGYDTTGPDSDGNYKLPSPDEELTWTKTIRAHKIGNTGKIGCALLLKDFNVGDIVAVTSFSATLNPDFDPVSFGTEGIDWAKATGRSGSESSSTDRIILEIPNGSENDLYNINLKFRVMNKNGEKITGNGSWERRLILTYNENTEEQTLPSHVYSLPGNKTLEGGQTVNPNDWTGSAYDKDNPDSDGNYKLPEPTEDVTWTKSSLIKAHKIGDTNKVGCALLLRDFSKDEIVQITNCSFNKVASNYIFNEAIGLYDGGSGNDHKPRLTWSIKGQELNPNSSYNVSMKWKVVNDDGGNISGNGRWGRRIQWSTNSNEYWLLESNADGHKSSYLKDGVPALPTASDLIEFTGVINTDENGKFIIPAMYDFEIGEIIIIEDVTATEVTA